MDMANQAISANYGSVNIYNTQAYKKYCERLQSEVSNPISFELKGSTKGMLSRIHAHMAKRKAIRAEYLQTARAELQVELEKQGVAFDGQNIIFKKTDSTGKDTQVTTITTETTKNVYTPNHTKKEIAAIEIEKAKLDKELSDLEKVDVSEMSDTQLLDHKVKLSVYHNAQKAFDVLQKSYAADNTGLETLNNKLKDAKEAIKEYYALKYGEAIKNDDNKIARIALGALLKSHKKPQTTTVVAFGELTTAGRKTEPAPTVTTTTTTVTTTEGKKDGEPVAPKGDEKPQDVTPVAPKDGEPVAPKGDEKPQDVTPPQAAEDEKPVVTTTTVTTTEVVEQPKPQDQTVVVVAEVAEPEEGTIEYTLKQQKIKEEQEKLELQKEAEAIAALIYIDNNGSVVNTDKQTIEEALKLIEKGAEIKVGKQVITVENLNSAMNSIMEAEMKAMAQRAIDEIKGLGDSKQNAKIATWFNDDNKILKAVMLYGDFAKLVDDDHLSDYWDNDNAYTNIIQAMKDVIIQISGNRNMFANEPAKYKLSGDVANDTVILLRLRNIYISTVEQRLSTLEQK